MIKKVWEREKNNEERHWEEIYRLLKETGKVIDGDRCDTVIVSREDGLMGIEFAVASFTGRNVRLAAYPRPLPPLNGMDGTRIFIPGARIGKKAYFFDLSSLSLPRGDQIVLEFDIFVMIPIMYGTKIARREIHLLVS